MLHLWTLYYNPSDYPGMYVARLFQGDKPTAVAMVCQSREMLEAALECQGLVSIARSENDDPCILGVWL